MECSNCGNTKAYKTVSGNGWEYCDRCGDFPTAAVPDVYWDGTPEHGLADDPKTGQPVVFSSKAEKARYLKERNLFEAGDKIHGAPFSSSGQSRQDASREAVAHALQYVRQMGADVRRREINRIMKESQR